MTQHGPNLIELYESAVQQMLPTLASVRADQLGASTPCTKWTVQNLITHNLKVPDFVRGIIQGNNTTNPMEVDDPLPAQGAGDAFSDGTTRVANLLKSTSDWSQIVETPFGPLPVTSWVMFPILDLVLHRWDLAKGTEQDASIDSSMAEACFEAMQQATEGGRQTGVFGPAIYVPLSASTQDKLLGVSGRQP